MAKILLVDDDEQFRTTMTSSLQESGHQVTPAENGKMADARLRNSEKFDLVISDIRMPGMDGIALLKSIRTYSKIPLILITGFSELLETENAASIGANEFLAKPIRLADMNLAIQKVLQPQAVTSEDDPTGYCRLSIDDFATGRQIKFGIYVRLPNDKFIKVAHKGEDISPERVRYYRDKGVTSLYLRREDFCKYVGFAINDTVTRVLTPAEQQKRANVLGHIGDVIARQIRHDGIASDIYATSVAFFEATLEVFTQDPKAVQILEALKAHTDHLLAHSVGVSLYSGMLAQHLKWTLPTNRFKVTLGGLLHDVGEKEIDSEMFKRPKRTWGEIEVRSYQSHPRLGLSILDELKDIPEDVREIVKQHHENCEAKGFPSALIKANIHPMARLIAVADEFCYRVLRTADSDGVEPKAAIQGMQTHCADQLDKKFLEALFEMFNARV